MLPRTTVALLVSTLAFACDRGDTARGHTAKIYVRGTACTFDVKATVADPPGASSTLRSGRIATAVSGTYESPEYRVAPGAKVTFEAAPAKGAACEGLSGELHLDGRAYSRTVKESPPFGTPFHLDVDVPP